MKKKILLFTATLFIVYFVTSSHFQGEAYFGLYDCTGAETGLGNVRGCTAPSTGCHSPVAFPGLELTLTVDSAGVPVSHYIGGMTYTVSISGTNPTGLNLPKFGFQVASIVGSTPQVTPVNAGIWQSTGLPDSVRYTPSRSGSYICNIVENAGHIAPSSGTGTSGTVYSESIQWTAPASGTGTVSFWLSMNAVNNDDITDTQDHWNVMNDSIMDWSALSVANAAKNINITSFPNPVINTINLQINNAEGNYHVAVYDLSGRMIMDQDVSVAGSNFSALFNTERWVAGMYYMCVSKDENNLKVIPVVKQ